MNVRSGHVFRLDRARGPVWYAKYRLPDGRQVQKKLGPAWSERGRPPAGYVTKRQARRWLLIYAVHETTLNVFALSPFFVLGPVIAKDRLGGAPAWSAIALGYVLGNLIAGHITYHWAPRRPVQAALFVSMCLAPMLALLGLGAPIWLVVPAALLAGVQSTIYNTLINSTQQANLPRTNWAGSQHSPGWGPRSWSQSAWAWQASLRM